ncbi:hypothetical protein [Pleomorphomonas oryzae]|uniref:hypothetical protein n=1 Tax=Pleomorphomonas oryzae TaxID=261934 RepID=UPI0003FCEDA3|nr:hypothetical protein [Pleomorphomonas oryzae]
MPFDEPPFFGPPSGRRYAHLLRPVATLIDAILAARDRTEDRFRGNGCWRRMLALGTMLAGLAGVPIVSLIAYRVNGRYFPGMASIFGGFLQSLLILRMAGPAIYADWLCMGLCDILIGGVLIFDSGLSGGLSLAAFGLCFALSSLARIWIGLTYRIANAFTWMGSSGLAGLFLLAWFLVVLLSTNDIGLELPMAADLVLRADLTLRGVALMGFGLSLRNRDD